MADDQLNTSISELSLEDEENCQEDRVLINLDEEVFPECDSGRFSRLIESRAQKECDSGHQRDRETVNSEELFEKTQDLANHLNYKDTGCDSGRELHDSGYPDISDRSLLSQSTLSQEERLDPEFKRLPALAKFWRKRRLEGGKIESECKRCSKTVKAKEISRLVKHSQNCGFTTLEEKEELNKVIDQHNTGLEISRINTSWTKVMMENTYSFNSVGSETFRKFFTQYLPAWQIPSRATFADKYVPHLSQKIEKKFMAKLRDSGETYLIVEFDHWKDGGKRDLLGVIVTFDDGSRYLLDLIDVSLESHAASVTVDKLKLCLSKIESHSINSFISDSASACKAAREQLLYLEKFQHVIQHRCLAHLINNIGSVISKTEPMHEILVKAKKLTETLANNSKIIAKMRQANLQKVGTPCAVRWYSYCEMFRQIIDGKTVIVEELSAGEQSKKPENKIVTDERFWSTITKAYEVIRPLAECIGAVEGKGTSLSQGMKCILDLGKQLFEADLNDHFNLIALTTYLQYISSEKLDNGEFGLLLASYILDPHYLQDYVTEDGIDAALFVILELASKMGFSSESLNASLIPAFNEFITAKIPAKSTQSSKSWWLKRYGDGPLREIALRLCHLKASSANIERTFSTLKYIQGSHRSRLANKTLVNMGRVKLSMLNKLDVTVETLPSYQASEANIHDDNQAILPPTTLREYLKFIKYIDFRVVNRSGNSDSASHPSLEPRTLAEMIRISRNSRAQKRAADSRD